MEGQCVRECDFVQTRSTGAHARRLGTGVQYPPRASGACARAVCDSCLAAMGCSVNGQVIITCTVLSTGDHA